MIRTIVARRLGAALAALTVAALTGCGSDHGGGDHAAAPTTAAGSPAGPTAGAQAFNDADVKFASDMIPHHQQALEMAAAADTRARNAKVKELAGKIKAAQQPEITQLTQWLRLWGRPVPSHAAGGGHGGHGGAPSMPGMMSDADMQRMMGASGAAFDRMFLEMMIRHHEGAIEMARTEQTNGVNPEAKKLAGTIATSQAAEIAEMRTLLTQV